MRVDFQGFFKGLREYYKCDIYKELFKNFENQKKDLFGRTRNGVF